MSREEKNRSTNQADALRQILQGVTDLESGQFVSSQLEPPDADELKVDSMMLSVIANDVLAGVDIAIQYPDFYRKLLAQPRLRQRFLDLLDLLEDAESEFLPFPVSTDLSFLKAAPSPPVIRLDAPNQWRARWQIFVGQLNQRLFPQGQPLYRQVSGVLDDNEFTLLRSIFQTGAEEIDLLLEAAVPLEEEGLLYLSLQVASPSTSSATVQAEIHWGDYQQTVTLDDSGQASFPPIAINEILDQAGQSFITDLHLELIAE